MLANAAWCTLRWAGVGAPSVVCLRPAGNTHSLVSGERQVVAGLALASEASAVKLLTPSMLQARLPHFSSTQAEAEVHLHGEYDASF